MSDTIIKLENISKQYRLGQVGTQTLRGDLQRWWHTLRGKEDPTLKIGQTNQLHTPASTSLSHRNPKLETVASTPLSHRDPEYVWALKDINLEVKRGEVLGIIGKNGAGKSTLLKLLSRVTAPTTGNIKVKGRIASLLEVGTGFHPELTGRENIFLNGAILGMTKTEIKGKFDEIVDFAGVAKYIDTPVKRYSSGMYVRLAFAVAAHLEPDILVVDEVLAVGDAEFQKKAIGKMQDISTGAGRTVLFVSHNMAAVKSLCNKGIQLLNGLKVYDGEVESCVAQYLKGNSTLLNHRIWNEKSEISNDEFEINELGLKAVGKEFSDPIFMNESVEFTARFKQFTDKKRIDLTLHFKDEQGNKLFSAGTFQALINSNVAKKKGEYEVKANIPANFFNWGIFYIDLYIVEDIKKVLFIENDILSFSISNNPIEIGRFMGREPGSLHPLFHWEKFLITK